MTNLTKSKEIEAFRNDDPIAFGKIYFRYHPAVIQFALYYLENRCDAEDVVAESFLKLWQLRRGFDNLNNILSFLTLTTRNACIDINRASKRKYRRIKEFTYLSKDFDEGPANDLDIRTDGFKHIIREIEKLPMRRKQVMQLYMDGYKNSEIANLLNVNIQTVMNQKVAALKNIRISFFKNLS